MTMHVLLEEYKQRWSQIKFSLGFFKGLALNAHAKYEIGTFVTRCLTPETKMRMMPKEYFEHLFKELQL
jgi:hypothetical protein